MGWREARLWPTPLGFVLITGRSANLGIGIAARGWKGTTVTERPEGWCREVSRS